VPDVSGSGEPVRRGAWASPENSDCVEYGTLYTLPASYPVPTDCHERQVAGCVWSSFVRLAVAMAKLHGVRASDQTGYSVVARVENPGRAYPDWDGDPYGLSWDDRLMRQFPWGDLRVQ
jgi:hypothetical protein